MANLIKYFSVEKQLRSQTTAEFELSEIVSLLAKDCELTVVSAK